MRQIRTIIVDDERLAREGIALLLSRDPEIRIVGSCGGGRQALRLITDDRVDLAFLDVQMPEMSGFEVIAAAPPERLPVVVFVTAYDRFALQAFKVHAVEYLLKPFSDRRFSQALAHAKEIIRLRRYGAFQGSLARLVETAGLDGLPPGAGAPRRTAPTIKGGRLSLRCDGRTIVIRADEIDWIAAADYCSQVHCGRSVHTVRQTMAALESRLDPGRFVRIHRSTIVNVDRVRAVEPGVGSERLAVLGDGTALAVSRRHRARLARALGE